MAIQKGQVAAKVWRVEQDIMAAKDMCIMTKPTTIPSTAARQPVKGDLVRPKKIPKQEEHRMLGNMSVTMAEMRDKLGFAEIQKAQAELVWKSLKISVDNHAKDHSRICLPLRV